MKKGLSGVELKRGGSAALTMKRVCSMEWLRFGSAMTLRFRVRHLEITTMIGCKVACIYCPQDKISRRYFGSDRMMKFAAYPFGSGQSRDGTQRQRDRLTIARYVPIMFPMASRWKHDRPMSRAEFAQHFPDETACARHLFQRRWPTGFVCPACGGVRGWELSGKRFTWECAGCGRQTSVTAGTVMHGSKLPLTAWFTAIHLLTSHSNGISALQLQAQLNCAAIRVRGCSCTSCAAPWSIQIVCRWLSWLKWTRARSPTGRRTPRRRAARAAAMTANC